MTDEDIQGPVTVIVTSRDKPKSPTTSGASTPDEVKRKAEAVEVAKVAKKLQHQEKLEGKAARRAEHGIKSDSQGDQLLANGFEEEAPSEGVLDSLVAEVRHEKADDEMNTVEKPRKPHDG